jgi:protein SCO1/2
VALLALAGCSGGDKEKADNPGGAIIRTTQDPNGLRGATLDRPYSLPAATLTDTGGNPFNLVTSTKKPVTLVFFGYTNCPDVCPTVMADVASALTKLDQPVRDQVQLLFITTDPARDTRTALRTYLDRFDPAFVGVTGPLDQIVDLAKPMGIDILKGQKLPSGGYEVDHTTNVIAVRRAEGDLVWTASTSPSDMATDLHKILKADS